MLVSSRSSANTAVLTHKSKRVIGPPLPKRHQIADPTMATITATTKTLPATLSVGLLHDEV